MKSTNQVTSNKQNKKRKHKELKEIDYKNTNISNASNISPPKKRAKICKRPSKKPNILSDSNTPNSHVTITFANLNNTIDAIILPKENVLLISDTILLSNKGKLSIKKSDIIQNEITPQISNDILLLDSISSSSISSSSISTIHSRNSFRIGCALFYCSDEESLFWAFPLRKTRRVSCQHYCCAANNKIVTRSVGIYSSKCNGKHNKNIKCIYAIANGKPPKGTINQKFMTNYQYFIHSKNIKLLIDNNNNGPPPLEYNTNNNNNNINNINNNNNNNNKKRIKKDLFSLTNEPNPFQQNVQINLKALTEMDNKNKLSQNISSITSSSSITSQSSDAAHDYTQLLLYSTSSCIRDIEKKNNNNNNNNNIEIESEIESENENENESVSIYNKCKQLLILGKFNEVIEILKPLIPCNNNTNNNNNNIINKYRLLMAISLYYISNSEQSLHFCNLILSNLNGNNSSIEWYEAKKLRGLIHKELRNYKAACHDFEFVCFNNPINKTWKDKLYLINNNKNKNKNIKKQIKNDTKYNLLRIPQLPLNQILTTHNNNNNYNNYLQQQQQQPLNINTLNILTQTITNNNSYLNINNINNINRNIKPIDIGNPNAPIVFIPPFMDRKKDNNNNNNNNNISYNNLGQISIEPKGLFIDKQTSNLSFEDMVSDLKRKTTREELLDDNINNNDNKSVSGTPEPLQRIRSDAI